MTDLSSLLMGQTGILAVGKASTCTTGQEQECGASSPSPDAQAPDVAPWIREFFRCQRWLESALASSPVRFLSLRDVFDLILDGRAFLWPGQNCCHVVEVSNVGKHRVAIAWLAGGDLSELLAMTPNIERWAVDEMGCVAALVIGRRGWARPLRAHGYVEQHTALVKELR